MALKQSYTLIAPFYDLLIERATRTQRQSSIKRLSLDSNHEVLIAGIGSGLDIPYLPHGPAYTGIDITPAMLARARHRANHREITLEEGDVMALPYADNRFDAIIMHLILAVVSEPQKALLEAERVLKPGGTLLILDKFLRPGQLAPVRRLLNVILRHLVTRTDVVFEHLHPHCTHLELLRDEPILAQGWFPQGWFRRIELRKRAHTAQGT